MSVSDLEDVHLEIVLHLANGLRQQEIADTMGWSIKQIEKKIAQARLITGANTVAHLVAIVISRGYFVYKLDDDEEKGRD